ncbi:MAG: hypothetical protein WCO56_15035 [Verrucomicrobiota bacterium]
MRKKLTISSVIVVGIAVVLFAWLRPAYKDARTNQCINYLRQIDAAKHQWAHENHKSAGEVVTWSDLVGPQKSMPTMVECPSGGTYTLGRVDEGPSCSVPEHRPPELNAPANGASRHR